MMPETRTPADLAATFPVLMATGLPAPLCTERHTKSGCRRLYRVDGVHACDGGHPLVIGQLDVVVGAQLRHHNGFSR